MAARSNVLIFILAIAAALRWATPLHAFAGEVEPLVLARLTHPDADNPGNLKVAEALASGRIAGVVFSSTSMVDKERFERLMSSMRVARADAVVAVDATPRLRASLAWWHGDEKESSQTVLPAVLASLGFNLDLSIPVAWPDDCVPSRDGAVRKAVAKTVVEIERRREYGIRSAVTLPTGGRSRDGGACRLDWRAAAAIVEALDLVGSLDAVALRGMPRDVRGGARLLEQGLAFRGPVIASGALGEYVPAGAAIVAVPAHEALEPHRRTVAAVARQRALAFVAPDRRELDVDPARVSAIGK